MLGRLVILTGRSGSGKDTAAEALTDRLGYQRVGLADPIRKIVNGLDGVEVDVPSGALPHPSLGLIDGGTADLGFLLQVLGLEHLKRRVPAVRRVMQSVGDGLKDAIGEDVLSVVAAGRVAGLLSIGHDVVVNDARYASEINTLIDRVDEALEEEDRQAYRTGRQPVVIGIDRPGRFTEGDSLTQHHSTELVDLLSMGVEHIVTNDGTVAELQEEVISIIYGDHGEPIAGS